MYTIVALAFCLLLGITLKAQGISALLWTPLGFAFGLFITAQMLLPLILGLSRAVRLVGKGQMRAAVLGRILVTPLIWFALLFAVGFGLEWLWPSALVFLGNNLAFNLSQWLGTIAIILSPLSKKARADLRADFERSYGQYYKEGAIDLASTDQSKKESEAAIRIASNLYLHTTKKTEDATEVLRLNLSDSKYRYLIFCFSAVIAACASEMENPSEVVNECLVALARGAVEQHSDFFDDPIEFATALNNGLIYLQEFNRQWAVYAELEEKGEYNIDTLASMIHSSEANVPTENADVQRLGELALEIACRMPAMRGAFVELVHG
jgi:hypothetical protein